MLFLVHCSCKTFSLNLAVNILFIFSNKRKGPSSRLKTQRESDLFGQKICKVVIGKKIEDGYIKKGKEERFLVTFSYTVNFSATIFLLQPSCPHCHFLSLATMPFTYEISVNPNPKRLHEYTDA